MPTTTTRRGPLGLKLLAAGLLLAAALIAAALVAFIASGGPLAG